MGTWGHGIRQDDFVCDVIGVFEDLLKAGKSVADTTGALMSKFAAQVSDCDDGPLLWIALADAQWTFGQLDPQVLKRVKEDFDSGRSLIRWTQDQRGLSRRRAALEKFIRKIAEPNPRPKKRPRIIVRAPKFRAGDCLSIRLPGGQYGAALVVAADHSDIEYGKNLIGVLNYLSPDKPTLEVFRLRKWLMRTHHGWNNEMDLGWYLYVGFRAIKDRLEKIGEVELLDSDPKDSKSYCSWTHIGEQVLCQRQWDGKQG